MQKAIEIGSPAPVALRRPSAVVRMENPATCFRVDLKPLEQDFFGKPIVFVCLKQSDHMEVRPDGRIEAQDAGNADLAGLGWLRHRRHGGPLLGGRVADDVGRALLGAPGVQEDEPVAAVQRPAACVRGQEGEIAERGRAQPPVPPRRRRLGQADEHAGIELVEVEEAGEGLGQLLAAVGVGDEAAPRRATHLKRQIDLTGMRERMSTMKPSVRPLPPPAAAPVTAGLRFFLESGPSMAVLRSICYGPRDREKWLGLGGETI